jgi:hypothetical protein
MGLRFLLLLATLFFTTSAAAAQLTLVWSDASNNEAGFRIERRISGGSFAQVAVLAANVTSFVDSSVTAGTTYCYRVRAYNQQVVSAYSNEACGAPASVPTVTISAATSTATEGGGAGRFIVRRTGSTAAPLTVSYTVGGTATGGSDYAALSQSVVIPTGASSAAITVSPTNNTTVEPNETVVVTLKAGTAYTVGSTSSSATVTIADDDPITVDNGGRGTSFTGTWLVSTGPNPFGSTSLYSAGAGQDTYRWTPTIPTTRIYDVYAWWTSLPNRSTAVQYQIRHAGGTAVVTKNQRTVGGQWVSLGTFQFNAGTAGYVQVSDVVNGDGVSADAIRWMPPGVRPAPSSIPPGGIVIDNGRSGTSFTGQWSTSSGSTPYGTGSVYDTGSGVDTYLWRPTIPSPRPYDVYVWWTAYPNRSANVQYRIVSAEGTALTTRDQRTGGGRWQYLGTFQFNTGTGGYVHVSDSNGSTVAADAALFVPR